LYVVDCRYDLAEKQYVAGVMEEDNPAHPELLLNNIDVGPGRTFTLYLFDAEKNHVRACRFESVCVVTLVTFKHSNRLFLHFGYTRCFGCCDVLQTIIRRLNLSQMASAAVNPFIEKLTPGAQRAGHSLTSSLPSSVSPKPTAIAGDVVIPGPAIRPDVALRPEFVRAAGDVERLTDEELNALRASGAGSASPFVTNVLCAVGRVSMCWCCNICRLCGWYSSIRTAILYGVFV
jgi:hypothetical protein